MFSIRQEGEHIVLEGRLDAAGAPRAQEFLDRVEEGPCTLDLGQLEYMSSAGLGVLLRTHKRMAGQSSGLKMVNVSPHIGDIFSYSGFDRLFDIEMAGDSGQS